MATQMSKSQLIEKISTSTELAKREQYWIDYYRWGRLFNLAPVSTSTLGVKYTDIAKANLRAAAKRKKPHMWTDAERAALAKRSRERVWTPEMRANLSAALKGKKRSAAIRAHFSEIRRGKPASATSRKVLLDFAKSKRSAETKKRMSAAAKLREAQKKANGFIPRKHPPDEIARMCVAQRERHAKSRQELFRGQLCLPI